jgi:hypothetical protein
VSRRLQHTIDFTDECTPTRKAKPAAVSGASNARVAWAFRPRTGLPLTDRSERGSRPRSGLSRVERDGHGDELECSQHRWRSTRTRPTSTAVRRWSRASAGSAGTGRDT